MICFDMGGASLVEICINGIKDGIVSIGPNSARLKDGVCRLSLSGILDGDYTPKLIAGEALIHLDEIRKVGNNLTRPSVKPEAFDKLSEKIERLIAAQSELEARLDCIEKKATSTLNITKQS